MQGLEPIDFTFWESDQQPTLACFFLHLLSKNRLRPKGVKRGPLCSNEWQRALQSVIGSDEMMYCEPILQILSWIPAVAREFDFEPEELATALGVVSATSTAHGEGVCQSLQRCGRRMVQRKQCIWRICDKREDNPVL